MAPGYFVKLTEKALEGDKAKAAGMQLHINPLVKQGVFLRKNPIPLAHMFDTYLRLPMCREDIQEEIDEVLSKYTNGELIDWKKYRK
jgi:hypothetical protein